jgi:DEAD/DEAH box helicase domain-containing protein
MHPQTNQAAVFIYDGTPGGAGLCRQAFARGRELLARTLQVIESCPCKTGCPACVHSPKCGSGNRPIDKHAALEVLKRLRRGPAREPGKVNILSQDQPVHVSMPSPHPSTDHQPPREESTRHDPVHYGVLDVETRRSAQEVGGWNKAHKMGVSCVVVYDSLKKDYTAYLQEDMRSMVHHLQTMDLVVGFNIKRFDYKVLSGLVDFDFSGLPTLDILEHVHRQLGYRLSLDHLAKATLGEQKTANGLLALQWWKQGKLDRIIKYCTQDVAVTRGLYRYGRDNGYLLFTNKARQTVRLPVDWNKA